MTKRRFSVIFLILSKNAERGAIMKAEIRNRKTISIDRTTPLQKQLEQLVSEGKISDDWSRRLSSSNYRSYHTRSAKLCLGECCFDETISYNMNIKATVAAINGIARNGDPYEFVAWLREMPGAGLEYPIVAYDMCYRDEHNKDLTYAPFAENKNGKRCLNAGCWIGGAISSPWRFLVVCED